MEEVIYCYGQYLHFLFRPLLSFKYTPKPCKKIGMFDTGALEVSENQTEKRGCQKNESL